MTETMETTDVPTAGTVSSKQKSGISRLAGIGVVAAVALPMLAAYTVFYTGLGMPRGTINQGELLTPAQAVPELPLLDEQGQAVNFAQEDPKWRYLIVSGDACDANCEGLLYTTRQVHIRLGDKAPRVERMLLTTAPLSEESRRKIAEQHPALRIATATSQQLSEWLADSDHAQLERPSALLVDQGGFAMMVYTGQHTGNQLLKDIKRLLKYSYEK